MWVFLKLALRPWNRSPLNQLMSGSAMGLLLALGGLLFWLERGLVPVVSRLDREQVLTVFVQKGSVEETGRLTTVRDAIRTSLGASEIREVSTPEFVRSLKADYPELSQELQELGPEAETIVPSHLVVTGEFTADQVSAVRVIPGVDSVDTSRDRYPQIISAFEALRTVCKALGLALILAILTGITQVSRMNAHLQADVLPILRLWGAGRFAIRAPAILGGLLLGVIAAGFASLAWWGFVPDLVTHLRSLSPMLATLPAPSAGAMAVLTVLGVGLGMLGGALGASTSLEDPR